MTNEEMKALYDKNKAEQIAELKKKQVTEDFFKENKCYELSQIVKCTDDLKLLKLVMSGKAVKKRCRKADYYSEDIYFMLDTEANRSLDFEALIIDTLAISKEKLENKFKTINSIKATIKEVKFGSASEVGGFYSMQEEIFGGEVYTMKLA